MTSTTLSSRLAYLDEARRLLTNESPAISAFLGSQYDMVARENDLKLSDTHRRSTCGGCGCLMIPERSCIRTEKKDIVKYECSRCNRYTIQAAPKRPEQQNVFRITKQSTDTKDTNASSKKRAKARKQGGLQAMLAKSREDVESASRKSQFGLEDFMM